MSDDKSTYFPRIIIIIGYFVYFSVILHLMCMWLRVFQELILLIEEFMVVVKEQLLLALIKEVSGSRSLHQLLMLMGTL